MKLFTSSPKGDRDDDDNAEGKYAMNISSRIHSHGILRTFHGTPAYKLLPALNNRRRSVCRQIATTAYTTVRNTFTEGTAYFCTHVYMLTEPFI